MAEKAKPKGINPYGDYPVADFLVAADASLREMRPFSGLSDKMDAVLNRAIFGGPTTPAGVAAEREKRMLRSVPGTVAGGGLGVLSNALLPVQAIGANMALGAAEGGTSDPDKPFDPWGAGTGALLSTLPMLRFPKLLPKDIPGESMIRQQIGESTPDFIKTTAKLWKNAEKPAEGFLSKLLGTYERSLKKMIGFPGMEGVVYPRIQKGVANIHDAIPHEGIHYTLAEANTALGKEQGQLEKEIYSQINKRYPNAADAVRNYLTGVYDPRYFPTELPSTLRDLVSTQRGKEYLRLMVGGSESQYRKLSTEIKRAYKSITKAAKEYNPYGD